MNRIVVIGGGGHARVLVSVLQKSDYEIVGYTDRSDRGNLLGTAYLGTDNELAGLRDRDRSVSAAIGVGKVDASEIRVQMLDRLEALGFSLPAVVSPHAVINCDVALGAGTVVLDGVVVNCGARAGRVCILNTNCTIEHDCRLGDNVHIAPGVAMSGGVTVGDHCLIGTGTCIVQGVRIGERVLVGAGTTVVADLVEPGVYVGNPARRIR